MSLKHLAQGNICPSLADGVLRFYNMRFCPYAQRTLIVLNAKNVKYEMVNIHLKNRPDWFYEKNPLGKVPVLEQNNKLMIESLVTCDYLDEVHPNPPLYPADSWSRNIEKGWMSVFGMKVINPLHKVLFNLNDTTKAQENLEKVTKGLSIFEKELCKRGTKYFGGDKPGMFDYIVWPWFERFSVINIVTGGTHNVLSEDKLPKLSAYLKDLSKDEAVASTILPTDQHFEFFVSFAKGEPNYDHGLEL